MIIKNIPVIRVPTIDLKPTEKVEGLTLHLIEMKKENDEQQKQLDMLLGKANR